jgi:hypothetical protein
LHTREAERAAFEKESEANIRALSRQNRIHDEHDTIEMDIRKSNMREKELASERSHMERMAVIAYKGSCDS